jgi:hypothetical protein
VRAQPAHIRHLPGVVHRRVSPGAPARLKVWEHEIPTRVLGSRPGGKKLWHRGRTQTNGRTLEA